MEENIIQDIKDIQVKYMNRKQIKDLRDAGLDPSMKQLEQEQIGDLVDWICDNIYTDEGEAAVIDNANYSDVVKLAMKTYKYSMTGELEEDEVKN